MSLSDPQPRSISKTPLFNRREPQGVNSQPALQGQFSTGLDTTEFGAPSTQWQSTNAVVVRRRAADLHASDTPQRPCDGASPRTSRSKRLSPALLRRQGVIPLSAIVVGLVAILLVGLTVFLPRVHGRARQHAPASGPGSQDC